MHKHVVLAICVCNKAFGDKEGHQYGHKEKLNVLGEVMRKIQRVEGT